MSGSKTGFAARGSECCGVRASRGSRRPATPGLPARSSGGRDTSRPATPPGACTWSSTTTARSSASTLERREPFTPSPRMALDPRILGVGWRSSGRSRSVISCCPPNPGALGATATPQAASGTPERSLSAGGIGSPAPNTPVRTTTRISRTSTRSSSATPPSSSTTTGTSSSST